MIYVEIRKEQIKVKELQIHALCGVNENNKKALIEAVEDYYQTVLPVSKETKKASFEEEAKKQLSEEIKSAFILNQKNEVDMNTLSKNENAFMMGNKFLQEDKIKRPAPNRRSTIKSPQGIIKEIK